MEGSKRFDVLDSFRGVCALSVALFHMRYSGSVTELSFFRHANLFVEFFFVLSGFVLAHSCSSNKKIIFGKFFISRVFRLFPLHVFMLIVFIFLEFGKLAAFKSGITFNSAPFTGASDPAEIIPNLLLVQSWTHLTADQSFNYPSWSISVEFYLYMIFAATLVYFSNFRVVAWGAISVAAFALLLSGGSLMTEASLRGLSCFFAGSVSYAIFDAVRKKLILSFFKATVLEVAILMLIVYIVVSEFDFKFLILSLVFCFTTILFAVEGGAVSKVLMTRLFRYLGHLSYSIYLTHVAILFCVTSVCMVAQKITGANFAPMIGDDRYIDFGDVILNNVAVILILVLVVFVSGFTYKYIEIGGQKVGRLLIARRLTHESSTPDSRSQA